MMNPNELRRRHADILNEYDNNLEAFEFFLQNLKNFFEGRSMSKYVHSVRSRVKDPDHLLEKVERKNTEDAARIPEERQGPITAENVFSKITDVAGLRVLHLHLSEVEGINHLLTSKIEEGEFYLFEAPKAYTWDPDSGKYFESLGLTWELKESYYTSVHYVLRPNSRSHATCEVQVRTLLEEVWGEIDHTMNYPEPTTDSHCKEQIRVLALLLGAGTHLADSIMRHYGNTEK
jgi:ppGpp synthetase/RelA/SpoT-type nucleotidyltranferase